MPFYYLNLRRGENHIPNDHEPQQFPDLAAAKAEAIESLREISDLAAKEERKLPDYEGIDILSAKGCFLLRVLMSDALKFAVGLVAFAP